MISNCYKWGMVWEQIRKITIREYERIEIGVIERMAEQWTHTRAIETAIINYGGLGAAKYVEAEKLRHIPLIDNKNIVIPIRTDEQAYKLLNTF